jgi:hypothetical protein
MARPRTVSGGVSPPPPASRLRSSSSDFSMELMPVEKIQRRTLHPWSVHHSVSTGNWIATITRLCDTSPGSNKARHTQFVFPSEREARKFCQAYAPPKMAGKEKCRGKFGDTITEAATFGNVYHHPTTTNLTPRCCIISQRLRHER